jgi:predicted enzyme related to lactoylglutathione lyase
VDNIDETLARIEAHGGQVVQKPSPDCPGGEWLARFRDPAGNVMGLHQEGARTCGESKP